MSTLAKRELSPEELRRLGPRRLLVRVRSIAYQGENINAYEVVDPAGNLLPPFEPGSHIDLYFRDQRVRQYSLCGDPRDRKRYVFAVLREAEGRGGSKAIFERVHVGRILAISEPRNSFALHPGAHRHLLLAGGIGVTPMMSMIHHLLATGGEFTLHYCTRSLERTAFLEELQPLVASGRVFVHHDGGNPQKGLKIDELLQRHEEGTHLYYCGPTGFMRAVRQASELWPVGTAHCEYFTPAPEAPVVATGDQAGGVQPSDMQGAISVGFEVKIASSGQVFDVPNDKSITQVLREHGIEVQTSCESGLCGACRTRYLEGIPDHRDYILDDEAKKREMLICCSRAKSPQIVLDL